MTPRTLKGLEGRLTHFLDELLAPMGRSERRRWARVYVQGLLLDGERMKAIVGRMQQIQTQLNSTPDGPPTASACREVQAKER